MNADLHLEFPPNKPQEKDLGEGNLVGWWCQVEKMRNLRSETRQGKLTKNALILELLRWVYDLNPAERFPRMSTIIFIHGDPRDINFPLCLSTLLHWSRRLVHRGGSSSAGHKAAAGKFRLWDMAVWVGDGRRHSRHLLQSLLKGLIIISSIFVITGRVVLPLKK